MMRVHSGVVASPGPVHLHRRGSGRLQCALVTVGGNRPRWRMTDVGPMKTAGTIRIMIYGRRKTAHTSSNSGQTQAECSRSQLQEPRRNYPALQGADALRTTRRHRAGNRERRYPKNEPRRSEARRTTRSPEISEGTKTLSRLRGVAEHPPTSASIRHRLLATAGSPCPRSSSATCRSRVFLSLSYIHAP